MDYDHIEKADASPAASALIETFRAIGYNIETAVADIVDNSVAAGASEIYFDSNWNEGDAYVSILDNGHGMSNEELIQAMRPGSQNPLTERDAKDLGRFGMGLKTASFSQCKQLCVMSKKKQVLSYWCWDLDYVQQTGKWELIRYVPKSFENALDDKECGTIVIWRHLDRVGLSAAKGTQAKGEDKFSEAVNLIDKHLSMIFHRFIEKKIVTVYCWGRAIRAWNPFAELQAATQACPPEQLHNEPEVQVQGYILPHKSKLNEKDHSYLGGTRGWGAQQGFYVYRGERLLVAGDWLGFFRKEDHYKLVRIRIDLPNHLDDQWQIDIRKSQARPPANTKEQLSNYAKSVRKKGVDVFRHRGNYVARISKKSDMLWLEQKKDNQYGYVINMEHSVIQQFLNRHSSVSAHKLQSLFALISECVPVKTIYMNEVDQGVGHKSKLKAAASIACRENFEAICVQLKEDGLTSKEIRYRLSDIEPFFHYPELLDEIDL